jgi:NADH:ubiquinone oxidoreductase subunit H
MRFATLFRFIPILFLFLVQAEVYAFSSLFFRSLFLIVGLGTSIFGIMRIGLNSTSKAAYLGFTRVACQRISYEVLISFLFLTPIVESGYF